MRSACCTADQVLPGHGAVNALVGEAFLHPLGAACFLLTAWRRLQDLIDAGKGDALPGTGEQVDEMAERFPGVVEPELVLPARFTAAVLEFQQLAEQCHHVVGVTRPARPRLMVGVVQKGESPGVLGAEYPHVLFAAGKARPLHVGACVVRSRGRKQAACPTPEQARPRPLGPDRLFFRCPFGRSQKTPSKLWRIVSRSSGDRNSSGLSSLAQPGDPPESPFIMPLLNAFMVSLLPGM